MVIEKTLVNNCLKFKFKSNGKNFVALLSVNEQSIFDEMIIENYYLSTTQSDYQLREIISEYKKLLDIEPDGYCQIIEEMEPWAMGKFLNLKIV